MPDVVDRVSQTLDDLSRKIESLASIDLTQDLELSSKINEIKLRALSVLKQARQKVSTILDDVEDVEQIEQSITIVQERSDQLYDEALKKIFDLKNGNLSKCDENFFTLAIDSVKKKANFPTENINKKTDKLKTTDVNKMALNTLKGWMK